MRMQRLLKLKKALKGSLMAVCSEAYKTGKTSIGRGRPLTPAEIQILANNGNHCDDWSLVTVDTAFTPDRVFQSFFVGHVQLPAFYGTVLMPGDVSFPTGIYSSMVHDCIIENALIHHVSLLSNIWVRQGAVIQNVGTMVANGKAHYQIGAEIAIGNEMGGRKIRVFPDMTPDLVEIQLFNRADAEVQASFVQQLDVWRGEIVIPYGVVDKNAVISNTNIVRNSWIGAHVRIDGASKIRNTVLLSSLEEPTHIYDDVILENSCVQEGVKVHSGAQVKDSVLMKSSKIGNKAIINSSIIAPGCHIDEAEVTCSFVGPLTQMHHHSLLISALWPEGCGNLGYGANVGSNHTGRMPDQEIYPGLGLFFGLGVNIKFPSNFSEAPFSVIATGVTASPQRLQFPFSLIKPGDYHLPSVPATLNEVVPAWGYSKNAYALDRNAFKYSVRGKGLLETVEFSIWSPKIAKLVLDAFRKLQVGTVKDVYTEADIPGLGSNFLREMTRQMALQSYANYLERYVIHALVATLEEDNSLLQQQPKELKKTITGEIFKEVAREVIVPDTMVELIKRYRHVEKQWYESVLHGVDRDVERGRKIFDDYDEVHPVDKNFIEWEKARFEEVLRCSSALLKELRIEA